jgi:hypothetical protein
LPFAGVEIAYAMEPRLLETINICDNAVALLQYLIDERRFSVIFGVVFDLDTRDQRDQT